MQTKQLAHFHMTTWDAQSADPGSISALIGCAKREIREAELIIAGYRLAREDVPGELYESKDFWAGYIGWGEPIVKHWWGSPPA